MLYDKHLRHTELKPLTLNFGPQHPAAHGVLRLVLTMTGEQILFIDPHIGLLHRGTEKLIETKTFMQGLSYLDRLDYVAMMAQEHTFALLIEKFCLLKIDNTTQYLRIIFLELTRILNHLLAIGCHAMDVGAMTPFLWCFEEREKIMEFYERVCGTRMHAAFIIPGGIAAPISKKLLFDIFLFCEQFPRRLVEIETMLTNNRIWKLRLINIGYISLQNAFNWGLSGVLLRGTGFPWDLRITNTYENYNEFNFNIILGTNSDCFDRYLIRLYEMQESIIIIVKALQQYQLLQDKEKITSGQPLRILSKKMMESTILHYKLITDSAFLPSNEVYLATEAPKGEFGIFAITIGSNFLYRCKFKAPGFNHLQALKWMATSHLLADIVTIIGTQDIVFGEIDR